MELQEGDNSENHLEALPIDEGSLLLLQNETNEFIEWGDEFALAYVRFRSVLCIGIDGRIDLMNTQMAQVMMTKYFEVASRRPPSFGVGFSEYILRDQELRMGVTHFILNHISLSKDGGLSVSIPSDERSLARLDDFTRNVGVIVKHFRNLLGEIREKLVLMSNADGLAAKLAPQREIDFKTPDILVSREGLKSRNLPIIKVDLEKLIAYVNDEPFVLKNEEVATFLQAIVDASKRHPAIISFPEMIRLHPILAVGNPTRYFKLLDAKIRAHIDRSSKGYWLREQDEKQ